jgi:hypothetical protein
VKSSERIQRNFELQQAYLHKYAQARFREVEHQYLVAEESLRERLLEAAFQRQRRYRIACQLDRDPMVLFGQPPVMIPPGFAGVPYQLLPARPRGASPAAMGTAANLTPEESLLLLERRPVSLGLEPGEASDDLREVQRAITALRRRAKAGNAHAGRAPGASGNETATDGQLLTSAGRAPSGPTGRQTSAAASPRPGPSRARTELQQLARQPSETVRCLLPVTWVSTGMTRNSALV